MRLIKSVIDGLACPAGRKDALFFDDEVKGFAVRVMPDSDGEGAAPKPGAKVFLFQYRHAGQVRRQVLGHYGDLTPTKARELAKQLRARVTLGEDPVGEARANREADRLRATSPAAGPRGLQADGGLPGSPGPLTLGGLVEAWSEAKARERREGPLKAAVSNLRYHFGDWWERPAAEITIDEVDERIASIARRSVPAALNPYRFGRAVFRWGVSARRIKASPFDGLVAPGRDRRRDRILTNAELGELWTVALAAGYPWGDWTRMLMLTLQRVEQVAGMRWSEISPDLDLWTIPADRSKNARQHFVHLTPAARAILRTAPRREECDLVFTTNGRTQMTAWSKLSAGLKRAIVEQRAAAASKAGSVLPTLEPPDWVFHDLRRNGVTAMASLGVAPHVADRILSHVGGTLSGVARIYQLHEFFAERREAMLLWEAYILDAAAGLDPQAEAVARRGAKVVQLPARGRPRR